MPPLRRVRAGAMLASLCWLGGCYLEGGLGVSTPRGTQVVEKELRPHAVVGVGISGKGDGPVRFAAGPTLNLTTIETESGSAMTIGGMAVGADVDVHKMDKDFSLAVSTRLAILGGTLEGGDSSFRAIAVTLGPSIEGIHGRRDDKSVLVSPAFRYVVLYGPDMATAHVFGFEVRIGHHWSSEAVARAL